MASPAYATGTPRSSGHASLYRHRVYGRRDDRYDAAVLVALEARDPDGAARAMFAHMQTVRDAVAGNTWRRPPAEPAAPAKPLSRETSL